VIVHFIDIGGIADHHFKLFSISFRMKPDTIQEKQVLQVINDNMVLKNSQFP
jgi:hypothetical protein